MDLNKFEYLKYTPMVKKKNNSDSTGDQERKKASTTAKGILQFLPEYSMFIYT